MIGTTFKLGFDGQLVSKGLSGLRGALGKFGKEIGVGAARKIGYGLTDMIGQLVASVPLATKDLMDWSGSLVDMSAQTKISTKDLMVLQEALRLAGVEGDPGSVLVTFKKNLYDAAKGSKPIQEALNSIGIGAQDLINLPLVDAFRQFGNAMVAMGDDFQGYEDVMSTVMGGKGGKKFIQFFRDFNGNMKQARSNVGQFAEDSAELLPIYDDIGDALGRWKTIRMSLASGLMQGLFGMNGLRQGADIVNMVMDKIMLMGPMLTKVGEEIRNLFMTFYDLFKSEGFLGGLAVIFKVIAEMFAEEFANAFKNTFNPFSNGKPKPQDIRPPSEIFREKFMNYSDLGGNKAGKSDNTRMLEKMYRESKDQTAYLERIYRENGTAMFA